MRVFTNTCGGRVDQTAVIGHAPESRNWHPGDPAHKPRIGTGTRIEAFVSVDAGLDAPTSVGERTWLMKHVHVGHDAVIGEDCELAPGVVIGGYCVIGRNVKIGVNACLRPNVVVGDNARIGAGAVVVSDIPANELWYGNPARAHPWPADSQPDYGSDPDPVRRAGWEREFGRAISRMAGGT